MFVSYRSLAGMSACLRGLAVIGEACATELRVDRIDIGQPYLAADYAFLDAAVDAVGRPEKRP